MTTAAKRPSLAKKHTRTTTTKTNDALDLGGEFFIDGQHYKITMGDLTALDTLELKRQVGMTFPQLLGGLLSDAFDLQHVAAVVWLSRYVNGGEKSLTFREVAGSIGYDVMELIREGAAEERKRIAAEAKKPKDADPEA